MIRSPGTVIARAPVRISFGGGGTDLAEYYMSHGGFVVSAAITRHAYAVASDSPDGSFHFSSCDYHIWQTFEGVPSVEEPLSLVKAAVEWFADYGLREIGVDLFLASEVPPGTGLGSSSAIVVALIEAIAAYLHRPFSRQAIAELACQIELHKLGAPIGKQDQFATAFGGLNAISFSRRDVLVEPIQIPPDAAAALERRLLLFFTGSARNSASILREQRDLAERRVSTTIDALHRIKSAALECRSYLERGEVDAIGDLLEQTWQAKRQLTAGISNRRIDTLYDVARGNGARGGKITGAGGGGFLLLYCVEADQERLTEALESHDARRMDFGFEKHGASVTSVDWGAPVDGEATPVLTRRAHEPVV